VLITLSVGFLFAALLGWLTVGRITRPLGEVSATLTRVADGDLTGTVTVRSRDEVGAMAGSLNRATGSMRGTVEALGTASHSLAAAAEQMSTTSTQIASSSAQASGQAASVSAAAEEISRNVDTVSAGSEEMGRLDPRDRAERQPGRRGRRPGGHHGRDHQPDRREAR